MTDPEPVVVAEADRVFWSTPRLGEWVDQALAPGWVFVVGTLFGMLAMIGFRRPRAEDLAATAHEPASADGGRAEEARSRHEDGPRHAAGRHRTSGTAGTAAVSTVVALALAATLTTAPPEPTLAAFGDTARATGTATTGTLVGASAIACTGGGLLGAPVLSWDVPTPLPAGGVEPPSWNVYRNGVTLPVATVTTRSYQVPAEILGVSTATYRVQGTAGTAPWSSPFSGTRTVNFGLLGVTCSTAT